MIKIIMRIFGSTFHSFFFPFSPASLAELCSLWCGFKDLFTLVVQGGVYMTPGPLSSPEQVHSGSLSWLYICLHDTTKKCYPVTSHPGVSSPRSSHRGQNFTPVRNLATVSCKREMTTRFGVKSVCR